jgi:hypothetical protein
MVIIQVKLIPKTWIRAPKMSKEQIERYIARGWISKEDESLDRAFPRTGDGKAFIPKSWIEASMVKACKMLGIDTKVAREGWHIVKKVGDRWLDVDYIEVDEKPLVYSRVISGQKQTLEVFEYLDGTFTITFHVEVKDEDLKKFMEVMALAGEVGMMSRTGKGYGKFKCEFVILNEGAEAKKVKKPMKSMEEKV